MASQLTVHDHGGSSIPIVTRINSARNKNIIWQQLKSKSNDFACRLRYMFGFLPKEAELLLLIRSIFSDNFRIPTDDLAIYAMSLELFEDVHDMFAARCRVRHIIAIMNENKYIRKLISRQVRLAHEKQGKSMPSRFSLVFRREFITGKWLKSNRYEDCYGLSLVLKKVNEHPVNFECPKLTLLQLQCRDDSQSIPDDFFEGMKKLRVLFLDLPSLPQSLNLLRNLRTLRLKVPKVEDMSWIGCLTTLEFFSINVLSLTDVPREMGLLENLRLLDLRKMNIAYFPPGILPRLSKLEAFYMPRSFRRWGCKGQKCNDYDEWEENNFVDDNRIAANISERMNATLTELVSLSLKALQISLPQASVLPKKPMIFENIQEFKILMPDNVMYQPSGEDSVNELQLTGEASDIKASGVCVLMSKTEKLSLTRVRSLKNVLFQLEDNDFAQLKRMIISECDELEYVVDTTEKKILSEGFYLFRKLECLHLSMLPRLEKICHGKWKYFRCLPNLIEINITFCHKLKYVFPLSVVKGSKIKSIEILDCNEMEGIFFEDEEDDFPLTLCSIEKLELHSLPRLTNLLVHEDDTTNGVNYNDNESLTTKKVSLIKSEKTVNNTEIDCVFPSKLAKKWLQNLKRLKLAFSGAKVIFSFEENHVASFNSLEELELHGLRNLVHVWFQVPPKITAFQNLQLLILSQCSNLYLFSPQVAMSLVQLRKVCISSCELMEEIIATEDGNERADKNQIVFPQLKLLELQQMPNLKFFYGGVHETDLPLLESLKLNQCNKMKCFSKGKLRTLLLERIEINGRLCSLIGDLNATMGRFEANQKGQLFIADLEIATRNFRPDGLVGNGENSAVYKGWIDQRIFAPPGPGNDTAIAIKKLDIKIQQWSKDWQLQVKYLGSLSHPNLVKLLGHCFEDNKLILVYEFMVRQSLDDYLFRGIYSTNLSWNKRIKIAIGAARGLDYLHTSEKKAIHGDMKSSNILLDESYNAKLKDYGLARLWRVSHNRRRRRVMNNYGYAAPESLSTGHSDAKSDVYGFGVVLLELMTGLRAVDMNRPNLVDWLKVIPLKEKRIKELMDVRIECEYSTEAMLLAAKLALKCVEYNAENRPSMKEVVEALHQIQGEENRTD